MLPPAQHEGTLSYSELLLAFSPCVDSLKKPDIQCELPRSKGDITPATSHVSNLKQLELLCIQVCLPCHLSVAMNPGSENGPGVVVQLSHSEAHHNPKSTQNLEREVTPDSDCYPLPTEEESKTLRKVAGSLPWVSFALCLVEFAERASYYGAKTVFSNFIQFPLPEGVYILLALV